ncbi:hypothetical protein JOD82_001816 [Paenibacillus sp. 1182]|uniref:hypothetical protein n=1 Tax=Paenibacillus sp. 1182 TaxID=2806565 RepID=UPI001AE9EC47|nr:hypothetical protein [Paenibacillus sp. 1182]MBP1308796.1 hypothetical protein [Paenibacillus sp. 1182]
MNVQNDILSKYIEFQRFLDGINMEELKSLSREDLSTLKKQLHEVNHRNLPYEIGKIIAKKKEDEFPQILGIHHYPELQEITFLNEATKLEIDKHLISFRVGQYLNSFYRFISSSEKVLMLEDFLVDKGIVEQMFIVKCPCCTHGHLSEPLTTEVWDALKKRIQSMEDEEDFDSLTDEGFLESYCMECDDEIDLSLLKNEKRIVVKKALKLIKSRDTTYDNV